MNISRLALYGILCSLIAVLIITSSTTLAKLPLKYIQVDIEPVPVESVVPELTAIVVLCAVPDSPATPSLVRLMTLIHSSGLQVGPVLDQFPPDPVVPPDPCIQMTREHILLARQVGVPSVMIVTSDLIIQTAPIIFTGPGQAGLGSWTESARLDDPCVTGKVTAICEMPAANQPNNQWRLWIGTENGFLLEVHYDPASAQFVSLGRYPVAVPPEPIHPVSNLTLIPQNGYTALGIGFGDEIHARRPLSDGGPPQHEFTLRYPAGGPSTIPQFDNFYPPDPISPTPLVFANLSNRTIDIAQIPSSSSGVITMNLSQYPPDPINTIRQIKTGSLLMLTDDSSAVLYDPLFSLSNGPSGCLLDISEGSSGECITCCDTPGDYNNDGSFNVADVTNGISRIFGSGPAPACQDEGDANGDNTFNIADVTYGIARIFSGGPAPLCGATGS